MIPGLFQRGLVPAPARQSENAVPKTPVQKPEPLQSEQPGPAPELPGRTATFKRLFRPCHPPVPLLGQMKRWFVWARCRTRRCFNTPTRHGAGSIRGTCTTNATSAGAGGTTVGPGLSHCISTAGGLHGSAPRTPLHPSPESSVFDSTCPQSEAKAWLKPKLL